ncbi:receptor-type tyrosine-protein phosphatase beta-like [Hyperolius riggenbachi]|uniref:receptor-type tyrosine-protein phosphatase beta-like n=1 Tax=Hyperolius riggenbachi TaxID=752182 RepID=UPI0035A3461A
MSPIASTIAATYWLVLAEPSCPSDSNTSECNITVGVTTSSISVSGLPNGFTVQNITDASGNAVPTSDGSYNNISSISFVSGAQYTIYYGNTSTSCCYNFTTKPLVVTSLSVGSKTTSSVTLSWSSLDYQSSYTYRVLTNVTSSLINSTTVTNTSTTITNLTPGGTYTFTVYTVAADNVTLSDPLAISDCTNPTPPGMITFNRIGTNNTTLSWGEAANMTNVAKSYNITYWKSSSPSAIAGSTTSTTTNVTLQNLTSGTNYTISVVTVGVRGYQSTAVTGWVVTKPLVVTSLIVGNKTTSSVTLSWSSLDYQSSYTYRVLTNVPSSSALLSNTTVTNTSTTITSLNPGGTYTFTVYTVAADNVTLSDLLAITDCTIPAQTPAVTVRNNQSVNSLVVNWTTPTGNVSSYNVSVTGDVNNTIQTTSTQAIFTSLLPGRNYTITVQTNSGSCSSAITTASEATYPTPPGMITFNAVGTYSTTLSWGEPANMTSVAKSYNITYWNSSSPSAIAGSTTSTTTNVTLQNLTSGTNYTFSVVTVGVWGHQSTAVTGWVITKPLVVTSLRVGNKTTSSVTLSWSTLDYQSSYTYRVLTFVTSSLINSTTVTNTSTTITNLIPGGTYTFTVYTVAADNVTLSDPLAITDCIIPAQTPAVTVRNNQSVNYLVVNWTTPAGNVSSYNVSMTGDVNNTVQTTSAQVTFTSLLPGRNYTITVQTNSGSCSSAITTASEATYPTPPGMINFNATGTNSIILSWGEPANMTNVAKSYNITYWKSSSPSTIAGSTTSTTTTVILQSLTSGTNYTISVVTVGVRGYQSTAVTGLVVTIPTPPGNINSTSSTTNSITLSWGEPANMAGVTKSYNVTYWSPSSPSAIAGSTTSNTTTVTLQNLTSGTNYTISVGTVVVGGYQSTAVTGWVVTIPTPPGNINFTSTTTNSITLSWGEPANMAGVTKSYNVTYWSLSSSSTWTVTTNTTIVTLQNLTSGANYTISVVTVGVGGYQSTAVNGSVVTIPTPPGNINVTSITTNSIALSWGEPANMAGVTKSYNVTYWSPSSPSAIAGSTTSTTTTVTLQNLTSGTNYTISVVTVGVGGYQSTAVTGWRVTIPTPPGNINFTSITTNSITLSWGEPANMAGVTKSYNVTYWNSSSSTTWTVTSNTTTVTLLNLTSGTNYTISVVTVVVGGYQSTAVNGSVVTIPTPPGNISITSTTTNSIALSWGEPANMVGVTKSYNVTYWNSSSFSTWTVTSSTTTVTLQSLTSGTNYTISVVTVVVGGYQSTAVTRWAVTKPQPVQNLQPVNVMSNMVTLNWTKPSEYQNSYSYRVQTYVTSSSTLQNTTIVTSESATIMNLTSGETYTFYVYTRAADGITESDAVTKTICIGLGQISSITPNNYNSTSIIGVTWLLSLGKVSYYNINLAGDVNSSSQRVSNSTTQTNFTGLSPGRLYNVTIQAVSGNCSLTSTPVQEATFPTPPGNINFTSIMTNSITLSWGEPANMAGVTKTYNVTYWNSSSPSTAWSVISNTTTVTLQYLMSSTNYTISVVTVGVRGYQSTAVTGWVVTIPSPPGNIIFTSTTTNSITLSWGEPANMAGVTKSYIVTYWNSSSSTTWNVTSGTTNVTLQNLTSGANYTISVVTVVVGGYQSTAVSGWGVTIPTPPGNISITSTTTNSITLSWGEPANMAGVIKSYNITYWSPSSPSAIAGSTTSTTTTVTLQSLTSGAIYTILVVTVGAWGYQSTAVTRWWITIPTAPGNISFTSITTNSIALSWGEPANMAGVTKSYNITYWNSLSSSAIAGSTTSNTTTVTLPNLTTGTNYTISVVTVVVGGYQSTAVTRWVVTKPLPVKSPQITAKDTSSVSLRWAQPDEYQNSYSYRVQTNITLWPVFISNMTVTSELATITGLTPGETYTFTVYTRAADGVTESDPESNTTCTVPGQAAGVTVDSYGSVNSLVVNWMAAAGKVSYYIINITGDVNNTIQTNNTQITFTALSPGREYTVTVQTVSGGCSSDINTVTNATYPTPPTSPAFVTIDTHNMTISWGDPDNMSGVTKNYSITYGNSSALSSGSPAVLPNLTSGTNYSIVVVTVGVWGYLSMPVTIYGFTNPMPVTNLQNISSTSSSVSLNWSKPNEYQNSYTYRVLTSMTSSSALQNNITVTSESATITGLTPQEMYTFSVFTVAADHSTESIPATIRTSTSPICYSGTAATRCEDCNGYCGVYGCHCRTDYSLCVPTNSCDTGNNTCCSAIPSWFWDSTLKCCSDQVHCYPECPSKRVCQAVGSEAQCVCDGTTYNGTIPEKTPFIMNSFRSVDSLVVNWGNPGGNVDYYIVSITGDLNYTIQTNDTQVTFTGLSPGRVYTVTVQTVSGSCGSDIATSSFFTDPTPPRSLNNTDTGTHNITWSWGEPANMTGVIKSYVITYWNSSSPSTTWSVTSNITSVTLQSLMSGTNYTISVVTVVVGGYQSTAVTRWVVTKPMPVTSLTSSQVTVSSVPLSWGKLAEYQATYTYRVQTNSTTASEHIDDTIVTTESATISGLTPGRTYLFSVYTRAADTTTESSPVTWSVCTVPASVSDFVKLSSNSQSCLLSWKCPDGDFASFTFGVVGSSSAPQPVIPSSCSNGMQQYNLTGLHPNVNYTISITTGSCDRSSVAMSVTCRTPVVYILPTGTPPTLSPPTYNQIPYSFYEFDSTNGAIAAYAVIVSSDNVANTQPKSSVLSKTYSNFKSKSTTQYVALIKDMSGSRRRVARDVAKTVNVVIGDGSGKDPYINGPLEPKSSYCVAVSGFTQINYNTDGTINASTSLYTITEYSSPISTPQDPGKGRRGKTPPLTPPQIWTSQVMTTETFIQHFDEQETYANLGFIEEFKELEHAGSGQLKTAAEHPENRKKNRYANVLPYDISRVRLSNNGVSTGDYINASFIPGYSSNKEFIAAQGPLPGTIADFWCMIWEKEVHVIIMLTKCIETEMVKCEEYWPSSSSKMYGNLSVSMTSETVDPDWTIRDFKVTNIYTIQTKQVRHFHFTAWPDHGVPRTTKELIQFRNLIHEYTANRFPPNSPILVHCSAGVGRTGTFIALDRIIKQIEDQDKLDVYGTVYDLQMHREAMVQSESQYVFLNQCAQDIIEAQTYSRIITL